VISVFVSSLTALALTALVPQKISEHTASSTEVLRRVRGPRGVGDSESERSAEEAEEERSTQERSDRRLLISPRKRKPSVFFFSFL
jgi:hypothetical protein